MSFEHRSFPRRREPKRTRRLSFLPKWIPAFAGVSGLLLACAPAQPPLPKQPVAADGRIVIAAELVPLDPKDPAKTQIGDFTYAGGLALTSEQTSRLHGLSDLHIDAGGRLTAISDEGDLLTARLLLDRSGRPTGLAEARIAPLPGLDGKPLPGKLAADAEGLAVLASGDRLVSFEQNHRVWLYPAAGGAPRPAPAPEASLPSNGGLEALAPDPATGPDAYIAGAEETGQTWTCRLSAACAEGPKVEKDAAFALVAIRKLPDGATAYLLRAWDPLRGNRNVLSIVGPAGEVARLELARPLTVDNFEGLAVVPIPRGLRFYLLSDDNFQSLQRTILMAFDWRPRAMGRIP